MSREEGVITRMREISATIEQLRHEYRMLQKERYLLQQRAYRQSIRRRKWVWWKDASGYSYTRGYEPIPLGAKVEVVSTKGSKWAQVRYADKVHWAPYDSLSPTPLSREAIRLARASARLSRGFSEIVRGMR